MKMDAPALATTPVTKPASAAPTTTGVEWRRRGFSGWVAGGGAAAGADAGSAPMLGLVPLSSLVMRISTSLVIGNRDGSERT